MSAPEFLTPAQSRRIAYHRTRGTAPASVPGVVFLGGLKSDMQGTKATHLEGLAGIRGLDFLRFDYSGHGESSGAFTDGCIGDWAEDAAEAIGALTEGPQILIGSSMGGWVSLLMARQMPERIAGLITIAAAPDFADAMQAEFTPEQRQEMEQTGQVARPSDYSDEPYIITRRLIEDGFEQRVLDRPLDLPFPVRMLQGTADTDVDMSVALRLLDHAQGPDIRLELLKGADHRFSDTQALAALEQALDEVLTLARAHG